GVLPHPFCNPAVKGCGFCTFPHETFHADRARAVVAAVCREVERAVRAEPHLAGRNVPAVYLGGGTANLTPPEPFRDLCRTLARSFDLSQAEVTLEGVPRYILTRDRALLGALREELPARAFRVSMGIQTFDDAQLRRMGRTAFGDAATFADVVRAAHGM